MKGITGIRIEDYKYDLPDSRIAKHPLMVRDQSKLLVSKGGNIYERPFNQLEKEIPEHNLLIRNNTRVIQARLIFKKSTGATIEVMCLEPHNPPDYEQNFAQKNRVEWMCLVGNAKKWKSGILESQIPLGDRIIILQASQIQQNTNQFLIRFEWVNSDLSFAGILEIAGSTPIPPYLNREAEPRDKKWYQTIYAQFSGSVAAPTAGLHFTDEVFSSLKNKNIEVEEVTLHVGAGTFRPVQTEQILDHTMHREPLFVSRTTLNRLIHHLVSGITAVGTTSLRTLESLYWLGLKIAIDKNAVLQDQLIGQWEPYLDHPEISPGESLDLLLKYLDINSMDEIRFTTRLIIVPGYQFRIVNRLITNFHQPGSTLLLLVAAFLGEEWRSVYNYALKNDFRFLSYGDSSILNLNLNNQ